LIFLNDLGEYVMCCYLINVLLYDIGRLFIYLIRMRKNNSYFKCWEFSV